MGGETMKRLILLFIILLVGAVPIFGIEGCSHRTSTGYYRDTDDYGRRGSHDRDYYDYEGNTINRPWYNEGGHIRDYD